MISQEVSKMDGEVKTLPRFAGLGGAEQ